MYVSWNSYIRKVGRVGEGEEDFLKVLLKGGMVRRSGEGGR